MWTATQKRELVSAEEWKKIRPTMIMLDPKSWTEIKKSWLAACRAANLDCNVQINSIESVIRKLDELAKRVLKP